MKQINGENIKVGDYLKGISKKPELKEGECDTTYFEVIKIDDIEASLEDGRRRERIWANSFFDFKNGKLLKIVKDEQFLYSDELNYYKITEEEYYKILGKIIITNSL